MDMTRKEKNIVLLFVSLLPKNLDKNQLRLLVHEIIPSANDEFIALIWKEYLETAKID